MVLVIAGERSGVGKTTVTLALLSYLQQQRSQVQSFKVGPDYIDPMFHQFVTGRPGRNLDPVLTSEAYVQQCFAQHLPGMDYALVEGVMGLFDGATGIEDWASTAHVARLLELPVLLVIDCSRLSRSVAAIAHGYRSLDPRVKLAGVLLNRVGSDRHLQLLQDVLEPLQLPILGVLRRQDDITIPDRHLGLVPTAELTQLDHLIDRLATLAATCFDWNLLLPLLKTSKSTLSIQPAKSDYLCTPKSKIQNPSWKVGRDGNRHRPLSAKSKIRLAVARDRAFSFYYQDNLDVLAALGAELIFWSPLADSLPLDVCGMYFGGGFPEVFAQELAANPALQAVRAALTAGMPTYAECGGLMYLCQQVVDFAGHSWDMVGVIPTTAVMQSRLTLGYRQATALQDSSAISAGTTVWGHEFHRSQLTEMPNQPLFQLRGYDPQSAISSEGWRSPHLHASYLHLHFGEQREIPRRFCQQASNFRDRY